MTFQLESPEIIEADREHEAATEPSPTARVIATSHVSIAVGDLITAAKQLGQGQGFDGLETIRQARVHLDHAESHLNGTVWNL